MTLVHWQWERGGECQLIEVLLAHTDKSNRCPIGFTVNEQLLCILEHKVDRSATEDVTYALRPTPPGTTTFQRKVYITNDLLQMVEFVDDLLALMSGIHKASPQPQPLSAPQTEELLLSPEQLVPVKPPTAPTAPTASSECLQEIAKELEVLQARVKKLETVKLVQKGVENLQL